MGELRGLITYTILAMLFFFAMLNFGIQFASDNGTNVSLMQDERINSSYSSIYTNLSSIQGDAQSGRTSVEADTPFASGGVLLITSIFGVAKRFFSIPIALYNISFGTVSTVLGVPMFVMNIIVGVILITGVLLFWKLIRVGES